MRIVDRQTFLSMPGGTVFQEYTPTTLVGQLKVKGESITDRRSGMYIDFFFQDLSGPVDAPDSNEMLERLMDASEHGAHLDLDFHVEERDGLFEEDAQYAIWDREDVGGLIDRLREALEAYPQLEDR